ncbi:MAG: quaternary ammonium compound-resistance protein SugE [Archangium gephyra]|uniref:Guanidinium exporter n=1 Tax=Archangium gephyra TaxID=48 RepID=A0A2W5TBP6_9BACT|nr:MAG: quaternary ammonium compound-resistance protein SugE [Archangium gephyra]
MAWVCLVLAGLLEVVWAVGLKHANGFSRLVPSVITVSAMFASFWLLSVAMRTLPLGTAYAIWTGIGAVGAFIVGILCFGEAITATRVTAILLVLSGLTLLKVSTP